MSVKNLDRMEHLDPVRSDMHPENPHLRFLDAEEGLQVHVATLHDNVQHVGIRIKHTGKEEKVLGKHARRKQNTKEKTKYKGEKKTEEK